MRHGTRRTATADGRRPSLVSYCGAVSSLPPLVLARSSSPHRLTQIKLLTSVPSHPTPLRPGGLNRALRHGRMRQLMRWDLTSGHLPDRPTLSFRHSTLPSHTSTHNVPRRRSRFCTCVQMRHLERKCSHDVPVAGVGSVGMGSDGGAPPGLLRKAHD